VACHGFPFGGTVPEEALLAANCPKYMVICPSRIILFLFTPRHGSGFAFFVYIREEKLAHTQRERISKGKSKSARPFIENPSDRKRKMILKKGGFRFTLTRYVS
jgi:hypothetical protein